MIYLPFDDVACYVIRDSNTIRVYDSRPAHNSTVGYTDVYINSHYLQQVGQQTFSQYGTLPTCLDNSKLTSDYWYRLDMPDILLMFIIIFIFTIYIPYKFISRIFGKWGRL